MKFGSAVALIAALSVLGLRAPAQAQEPFGVHCVAVDQPGSPVKITAFRFGRNGYSGHGPTVVVANQSEGRIASYTLQVEYFASKGCNILGTPDASYDFIHIGTDLGGSGHSIALGSSRENPLGIEPEETLRFLSGDSSAYFPPNLKVGYIHAQVRVTSVSLEGGPSWQDRTQGDPNHPEKYLYDHAAYDEDRVDCERWKPVMGRLNDNMKWTDVVTVYPRKAERLGAGLVQSSHGGSVEVFYTCAFTESEQFIKSTKRAALVCPNLSK